jgi:hypothetical protein
VEVQITPAGANPDPEAWTLARDTSGDGDYSTWTYSQSIRRLRKGTYVVWARVVSGGVEVARTGPVTFRKV